MGIIDDLKNQLNARVLYALIGLGFLVGLVLISDYGVKINDLRIERKSLQNRLAQYGDQIDEQLWRDRLEEVSVLEELWSKRYWREETSGIIGSQIQTKLGLIGSQSEFQRIRSTTDEAEDASGERALRVRVFGQAYEAYDVIKAIALIAKNEPNIILDEVNITVRKHNETSVVLSGLAPVDLVSGQQPTSQTAPQQPTPVSAPTSQVTP